MKIEIANDFPKGSLTTKTAKVYKVIKDLYESDNECIKITDEEKEFKDTTQLRNLLSEQAKKYSREFLAACGIRTSEMYRYQIAYRENAFIVRKENCKAVIYVKVDRFTEEEINDIKQRIEEAKNKAEERRKRRLEMQQKGDVL